MKGKIIQIIPAPTDLRAVYDDPNTPSGTISIPVLCLALVELGDKETEVRPMVTVSDGGVEWATDSANFSALVHIQKLEESS